MHGIGEINRLIGGQIIQQVFVKRDEFRLLRFIRHMWQRLWLAIFKPQSTQQLQAARVGIA